MAAEIPFGLRISARAERDLAQLPDKIAVACVEFIFGPLVENPHRVGKALRAELTGLHSARRGSYRVIYLVDDESRRVEVVHITHRADAYR